MRPITVSRPSPAFLLALVALLFAMAGTGYAASSISGKLLKNRSVSAQKVSKNSLTGAEIKESRLGTVPRAQTAESAQSAVTAETAKTADSAKTALSAETAKAAETAKTAETAADAAKLGGKTSAQFLGSGRVMRVQKLQNVAVNTTTELAATCATGEVAVAGGGGWYIVNTNTAVASAVLSVSAPELANGQMTGWRVEGKNVSPVARDFHAYVVCLPVG